MHTDQPTREDLDDYTDWLAARFTRLDELEQLRAHVQRDIDDACEELDDESLEVVFTALEHRDRDDRHRRH